MNNIIEVNNLKKSFKEVKAVDGISFIVHEGEFFAFLGQNGAGKSTTINIITGALEKDEGEVKVDGLDIEKDLSKIKGNIGIVYQSGVLDRFLTVYDNLRFKAALYGYTGDKFNKRLEEIKTQFELEPLLSRPLGKLSGGQKRRVDIARALFHEPKILILDEPTTGLDPQTRQRVWDVVTEEQRKKNLTVFLTTHYMEEAAESHYVVIIDKGKIVAKGTPIDLKSRYSYDSLLIHHPSKEAISLLQNKGLNYSIKDETVKVRIKDSIEARDLISEHPSAFTDFEVIKGTMDDVFLNATGKDISKEEN
jgi:multidrug/hemolysin transport system ATP-binding protein